MADLLNVEAPWVGTPVQWNEVDIRALQQERIRPQPRLRSIGGNKLKELKKEHARLMRKHKAVPDHMPVDGGIIKVLPKF